MLNFIDTLSSPIPSIPSTQDCISILHTQFTPKLRTLYKQHANVDSSFKNKIENVFKQYYVNSGVHGSANHELYSFIRSTPYHQYLIYLASIYKSSRRMKFHG